MGLAGGCRVLLDLSTAVVADSGRGRGVPQETLGNVWLRPGWVLQAPSGSRPGTLLNMHNAQQRTIQPEMTGVRGREALVYRTCSQQGGKTGHWGQKNLGYYNNLQHIKVP